MISRKRKVFSAIGYAAIAILLVATIGGNILAMQWSSIISIFFNHQTYQVVSDGTAEGNTDYYVSDYTKLTDLVSAEAAYAEEVQAEGAVLLQNPNQVLPIDKNLNITLLGMGCATENFLYGGGGSGSIDTSKTPSLKDVFEEKGYTVNPTMWNFYHVGEGSGYKRNVGEGAVSEVPVSAYGTEEKESFTEYRDAAIVVIGLSGSEGYDLPLFTAEDPSKHILELSQDQLDLIDMAEENFEKVVILLNTMGPIELGPIENRNLACVWIGGGGQNGLSAIPDLLNGDRYPSGRNVDTYAYDALSAPAMVNFGDYTFTNMPESLELADKYLFYQEGVYIGYKYYETRYADAVMQQGNAGEYNYSAEVQFPFGYGLSYTDFAYSDYAMEETGDSFTFRVTVTNQGERKGKEVVQIYMQSPFTDYDRQNGVEKSAVELVGFAKTKELAPKEAETVTVTVPKESLRVYDAQGAGTYIVDAGEYFFAVGRNAHDALNNILSAQGYTTAQGMTEAGNDEFTAVYIQAAMDTETYSIGVDGEKIENVLQEADLKYYDDTVTYLSRTDWIGTWPTPLGGVQGQMEATPEMIADMQAVHDEDPNAIMPVTGAEKQVSLSALRGLPYDHELWDMLLDQMTPAEMMSLAGHGGYATDRVNSIDKPSTIDKDGPAGITSTLVGGAGCFGFGVEVLTASTWNVDLARQLGNFIGEDSLYSGVNGWYAPGVNMHRTPFNGRNFEYFSEDSYISGVISANIIQAAENKGVYCYVKHYALNDQYQNSVRMSTFANEQAIREIYLRPFEISVREGGASALMVSVNRIGVKWAGAIHGLMTDILRDEWGFEGMAVTDTAITKNAKMDIWDGMAAGTDLWLCAGQNVWDIDGYASNPTVMTLLRGASKNILYTVANSNAMNGLSANSRVVSVTPLWQKWMYCFDAGVAALSIFGIVMITRGLRKAKKKEHEA